MQRSSNIGGQAVMEGIMMRNGGTYSVAVRKPDHTIELKTEPYKSLGPKWVGKVPIVRGMFAFVDSLRVGIGSLMWSAEFAAEDEEEEAEKKQEKDPEKEAREWKIIMTITMIVSIGFSVGLFVVLPYLLSSLLRRIGAHEILVSVTEALLRVVIFMLYMFLISRMKDIQRVFSYHGAEHKCINCIESGLDLNVENVLKSSRRHKRCGTSFLLIVIVISVIAFLFIGLLGITSPLWRFLVRIILVPVIAGVAFEFLHVAGASDNPVVCTLAKPGLALQGLVTRDPDAEMAEVAIAAVNAVFDWKAWQEEQGIRS